MIFASLKATNTVARDTDLLTTSWYLNHSDEPNVAADEHYLFYALRDIKAEEELTVDYHTYSDEP